MTASATGTTGSAASPARQQLQLGLADVPGSAAWRWQVRRLLAQVRDLLVAETPSAYDGWLAARGAGVRRERRLLLGRLAEIGPQVLHERAIDDLRSRLDRLLTDVDRHLQRRRDLAWDEVELELGGSE